MLASGFRQSAPVLELLAGKDQTLLIRRDALLASDLLLDIVDGVGRFDVQRDGLAREHLDEDLHSSPTILHGTIGRGRRPGDRLPDQMMTFLLLLCLVLSDKTSKTAHTDAVPGTGLPVPLTRR